jgi:uncharacterized protein (TIGR02680 family)
MTALPVPSSGRWRPLRLGLVDLFYYDRQEFWFRDGRLMLRGNNGTGKSKVLALTLPFLLDGDTSAHRVEPDGDPKKRMDWNLLLGGKYEDRLGYTWMEFGRVDDEGRERFRTIGVGLRAVRGKGVSDKWFFTTTQRIGAGLELVGDAGTALTRERLGDAVGTEGDVVRAAAHYRRLIDDQLFHLGEERYDALIDLLVQLRQPQLSKRPDERKLSAALSQALSPLDHDILSDVAEAFHDQATQRDALEGLKATAKAAKRFGDRYRDYARTAARRFAENVRRTQSAYERQGSTAKQLGEEAERIKADRDRTRAELDVLDEHIALAEARVRQLESRNELADLHAAEQFAATAATTSAREEARRDDLREQHAAAAEAAEKAAEAAEELREGARSGFADAAAAADRAAMDARHRRIVAPVSDLDTTVGRESILAARSASGAAADEQEQHVGTLLEHCRVVEERQRETAGAAKELSSLEQLRDEAADAAADADAALSVARDEHFAAWTAFRPHEFPPIDIDAVGLREWTETLAGFNPATAAAQTAYQAASRALADAASNERARITSAEADAAGLADEQRLLTEGNLRTPMPPQTRRADRTGRPGAPMWQVVDFRDHIGEAERAGFEAALEAAGLLDAWIDPEGRITAPGVLDGFLTGGEPEPRNATAVLTPAIDPEDSCAAAIPPAAVETLIAAIGIGHGRNWISPDGRYRIGPLEGAWAKPEAEYIGHAAREAARTRRLAELAVEIARAEAEAEQARRALSAIDDRLSALDQDLHSLPKDQSLRDAQQRFVLAETELERRRDAVRDQQEIVARLRTDLEEETTGLELLAADLRLPADPKSLNAIGVAIGRYRGAAAELWGALDALRTVQSTLLRAQSEFAAVRQRLGQAEDEYREAANEAAAADARLQQLRSNIGATVDELLRALETVRGELGQLGTQRRTTARIHQETGEQVARLHGRIEQVQSDQSTTAAARAEAIERLRGFCSTGLQTVAVSDADIPDLERAWAPDPAVQLARRIERELTAVVSDDDTWNRVQAATSRDYQTFVEAVGPHGHQPGGELTHDCFVVTLTHNGKRLFPGELADVLTEDVEYRERLLGAKERELLEEHLINEVAHHLQQLIEAADAQVEKINAELAERPTSTGMRLRLKWRPVKDGPEGLREVRRLLLHEDSNMWSPDDQALVGGFLHRQIQKEAAEHPESTWESHLSNALDYRRWHGFKIERHQNGEWKDAVGPASGGERVLTVSLPLFAAASSHYRSAYEHAPRMVMLDEAFAGVDDDSRAKCLGLLTSFDLDVAMTSEREWGFYSTVPGIRTHQLVRTDDIDAVFVTVFEWDGRTRSSVQDPS